MKAWLTIALLVSRFGGEISDKSWRREIMAGRLKAIRARPSANAKLLVSETELQRWLDDHASKRAIIPSVPSIPTVAASVQNKSRRQS